MFGYMHWLYDMDNRSNDDLDDYSDDNMDDEIPDPHFVLALEKDDVHTAVLLREFADLEGDGSDEFKAARLIAEAICMQLCTHVIPPEKGDFDETLVIIDRKNKRFELPVDMEIVRIDPSPLLTGECAL